MSMVNDYNIHINNYFFHHQYHHHYHFHPPLASPLLSKWIYGLLIIISSFTMKLLFLLILFWCLIRIVFCFPYEALTQRILEVILLRNLLQVRAYLTPKLVDVNRWDADVAEFAVVCEKKALIFASKLLITVGTPGHM